MPTVLDLFCCAGGAAMGYHRAGYEVVGVDIDPQPHYPFTFHQADALSFPLDGFDLIHASPPCQAFSSMTSFVQGNAGRANHLNLIPATRERLQASGIPYIIENVPRAPLLDPVMLCGSMFPELVYNGMQLRRHRLFESSLPLTVEMSCDHRGRALGVYGQGGCRHYLTDGRGGYQGSADEKRAVMGTPWMTGAECSQAIPPAYTAYLGGQALSLTGVEDGRRGQAC